MRTPLNGIVGLLEIDKKHAEDVQKSLDAGMNAHIAKPLDIDKMIRTIAQYRKNDSLTQNNLEG